MDYTSLRVQETAGYCYLVSVCVLCDEAPSRCTC